MDERDLHPAATAVAGPCSDALTEALRRLSSVGATSAELGPESVAARAALLRQLLDRLLAPMTGAAAAPVPLR